jgi:aminoglycoside phosphotransferase (APT) family kinase protein
VNEELRRRIEARLAVQAPAVVQVEEGWDSSVLEVNGKWIVRVPRRDEVREWIRREARLLPELARALPVPVPRFEVLEDSDIFFVAYRRLPGGPLHEAPVALAAELGVFLAALHGFPRERALRSGLDGVDAAGWLTRQRDLIERCVRDVVPLLAEDERLRARWMFDGFLSSWHNSLQTVLIHADLGPAHILHEGSSLTGVIDWSDACLGDAALDFAWLLHGTSQAFTRSLLDAYSCEREPAADLRERAFFYHRLGPWHEVLYGLEHDRANLVESGLAGIRNRLPE